MKLQLLPNWCTILLITLQGVPKERFGIRKTQDNSMEQMDTQRCMGLDKCNGLIVFTHPVLVKEREFHTKHNNEQLYQ